MSATIALSRRSRVAAWLAHMAQAMRAAPAATFAGFIVLVLVLYAFLLPLFMPDPFNLAVSSIIDAFTPPVWLPQGDPSFPLGTDDQGRNLLSALAYGLRTSLIVGLASVALGLVIGVALGLVAGFAGGIVDTIIMRAGEVQLAYPALLLAMIVDGAVRAGVGPTRANSYSIIVVVVSIGFAYWVQYARTIRSSVLVERDQDYVAAARITGRSTLAILTLHILPNVMAPVLVVATINLAIAIITEATLSFLGIGIPVSQASLGTLLRTGSGFLQSGQWWIAAWPCILLVMFVAAINVVGDHLRDVFNPRLRTRQ